MTRILGFTLALIFAALSLLHLFWAAGGKFGVGAALPSVGGRRLFNPSPLGTLAVAAALLAAALVVLGRLGAWGASIPARIFKVGTWGISLLFLLRAVGDFRYVGFFKSVSGTDFAWWDAYLFSPLCLFVAAVAFLISFDGT